MKKIEALKTGKWADSDGPHKPVIVMVKGRTYMEKKVPIHMMDYLVGKKFAKLVGEGAQDVEDEKETIRDTSGPKEKVDVDIKIILGEIVESTTGKRLAKDALETWAKVNLNGYDLDKSKSLDDCVAVLVGVYNEQNGD